MTDVRNEQHLDTAVRAAVFETVTLEEARRILRSRAGRPWNAAAAEFLIEAMQPPDDPGEALAYVRDYNRQAGL